MTSWGMNQTSAFSNCSLQLGNQTCNHTSSVAATIAPCLCLFVCEAERLEEEENASRAFSLCVLEYEVVCVLGGVCAVKWSIPHPQSSLSKSIRWLWANQAQSEPQNKAPHTQAPCSALFIGSLFANFNLQRSNSPSPTTPTPLTGCLNGPLISLKWQSVNMH